MKIFNKLRGTRGIIKTWEEGLRDSVSIQRLRVLAFWRKHGLEATKEAFSVSRRTLFRWQTRSTHHAIAPNNRAPKGRRSRTTPSAVSEFIIAERKQHFHLGKEKLQVLLQEQGYAYSASTVGRILSDLRRQGRLSNNRRQSFYGKTGKFRAYSRPNIKKQRRPKGSRCLEVDTIVRFIGGIKRYVVTAVDTEHRFAFAGAYTGHTSVTAADLLQRYAQVSPLPLPPIQTDNGSEFAYRFREACQRLGLIQYHTYPHCPKMNGSVERFNRTLSEDFIEPNKYLLRDDIGAFNQKLADWLLWYNTRRPHASLGQISPLRYIINKSTSPECHMWWTRTAS